MLTYDEAMTAIMRNVQPLGKTTVPLSGALGRILDENIKAGLPFPHFDNSAVDGFAVRFGSKNQTEFKFKGEIPAGFSKNAALKPGQAMAIFTGAPVPRGTDAVAMQEIAERRNGSVYLKEPPEFSAHIRRRGEDFQKGDRLLARGLFLEPSHIALLAALGQRTLKVTRAPSVSVLATGSEIVPAGKKLPRGGIYDSNTPLLEAMIRKAGASPVAFSMTGDDLPAIRKVLREALKQDVLIVSGGVSVGKYDFVKEALRLEGVREIFWKIDIKPGKPVFFGKKGRTLVFGLPGNPVSVYVTFEEFVKPALFKMMRRKPVNRWIEGALNRSYGNGSRPHFIRVQCRARGRRYSISLLKGQGSHQIGTLARSNGIMKVEPGQILTAGQKVRVKIMSENFS